MGHLHIGLLVQGVFRVSGPSYIDPLFQPVVLDQLNLDPLLKNLLEKNCTKIPKVVHNSHQFNLDRIGFWHTTIETNLKIASKHHPRLLMG